MAIENTALPAISSRKPPSVEWSSCGNQMQAAHLVLHKRTDFQRYMSAEGKTDNVEGSAMHRLVDRLRNMTEVVVAGDGRDDGETVETENA